MTTEDHPSTAWQPGLDEWLERLPGEGQVLVASDFDGTLSEVARRPEEAVMVERAAAVMLRLARLAPRVRLAFISGRSLASLIPVLGGLERHATLSGNHGLEILTTGQERWVHPASVEIRGALEDLIRDLHLAVGEVRGVEIEDKELSLTLHYRRADQDGVPAMLERIDALTLPEGVSRHAGKMVLEYRPAVEWHKGKALRKLAEEAGIGEAAVLYLGDDLSDEDVFREFGPAGFMVHVGPPGTPTAARWRVGNPSTAAALLERVAAFLGTS